MDADEKLRGLKMAYADILLGISQEARARVMESDRKSARYKYELEATRDEGVRLLERLRRMMESQSIESQVAALNRQKKIDELEAQLQEAEDIVSDLRGELRQVQDELERVIKTKNSNGPVLEIPQMNTYNSYSYQSSVPYSIQLNRCGKCCNKMVCKETELYRNGCTQRIHACDGNSLSLSEEDVRVKDKERGSKDMLGRFDSFPKRKRSIGILLAGSKSNLSKDSETNLVQVKDRNTVRKDSVKMDVEKVDGQLNSPKEKDFKFTFQRRRKRQAPSELEADASLQTGKKMRDGNTASLDNKPEEIKLESAHESRRLALVARQLMALSKSKW